MAEPAEAEVAIRAIHAGVGHEDVAARRRPPRCLTERDDPAVLLNLFRVIEQELRQLAGTLEEVAFGHQPLGSLLTSLAIEERCQLQAYLAHTLTDLEVLGGDVRVDVLEVVRTDRPLNEQSQSEGVVDGRREADDDLVGVVQECLEHGPTDAPLLVLIQQLCDLILRDVAHDASSFSPVGNSYASALARHVN